MLHFDCFSYSMREVQRPFGISGGAAASDKRKRNNSRFSVVITRFFSVSNHFQLGTVLDHFQPVVATGEPFLDSFGLKIAIHFQSSVGPIITNQTESKIDVSGCLYRGKSGGVSQGLKKEVNIFQRKSKNRCSLFYFLDVSQTKTVGF